MNYSLTLHFIVILHIGRNLSLYNYQVICMITGEAGVHPNSEPGGEPKYTTQMKHMTIQSQFRITI